MILIKSDRSHFDGIDEELQSLNIGDRQRSAIMADVRARSAEALAASEHRNIAANVALARTMHKCRLRANDAMGARILCDPKFDMLLALFVNHHEHRSLCVGDLCLATNVPQTTALRHVDKLEAQGFVTRSADPFDGRRWWVVPTARAIDGIAAMMTDLRRSA